MIDRILRKFGIVRVCTLEGWLRTHNEHHPINPIPDKVHTYYYNIGAHSTSDYIFHKLERLKERNERQSR